MTQSENPTQPTPSPADDDGLAAVFVVGSFIQAQTLYVDRLPRPGESLAARELRSEQGGKGLNLAVGLHRLGLDVSLLLAVGDDAAGAGLRERLRAEGMAIDRLLTLGARSGCGVVFVAPDGSNFLAILAGANALLEAAHVDRALSDLPRGAWVCGQFELPDAALLRAFEIARTRGGRTFLNPSPWRTPPQALLRATDVLVVNEAEAAALLGLDASARLSRAQWSESLPSLAAAKGWQGEWLVVTLAEQGSVALDAHGQVRSAPAYRVKQQDATGAGDAFGSGLIAALSRSGTLEHALRYANACGALVAASEGVLDALPGSARVAEFMRTASTCDD